MLLRFRKKERGKKDHSRGQDGAQTSRGKPPCESVTWGRFGKPEVKGERTLPERIKLASYTGPSRSKGTEENR